MPAELTLELPATMTGLMAGLNGIERYGVERNIESATVARLKIIIEELYSNTIKYGYGGECSRPVRLRLQSSAAPGVTLIYEDEAPSFDTTAWNTEAVLARVPEQEIVGQTGVALIWGLASGAEYTPLTPGNRLVISLA